MSSPFACSSSIVRRGAASRWSLRLVGLAASLVLLACRPTAAGTSLRIEVPQEDLDADVYVDGLYLGQVSALGKEPAGPVMLAPGDHRVEVRKAGRFPVQRTVRVDRTTAAQTVVTAELLEDPQ